MAQGNGLFSKLPQALETKGLGWTIFEQLKAKVAVKVSVLLYLMIPQFNINIIHSLEIDPLIIGLKVIKQPYFIPRVK
jgi:hypothetical protein